MAIAHVQTKQQSPTVATRASSVLAVSETFAATPAVGNLVVVFLGFFSSGAGSSSFSSVTDNQTPPNIWTIEENNFQVASSNGVAIAWSIVTTAVGTFTVTANFASNSDGCIGISEFSGVKSSLPVDGSNSGIGNSAFPSGGSVAPSQSGDLFVSAASDDSIGSHTYVIPSGWDGKRAENPSGGEVLSSASKIATDASTQSSDWSSGNPTGWQAAIVAFKATGGIPSPVLVQSYASPSEDSTGTTFTTFKFTLPNVVRVGNTLVMFVAASFQTGQTCTITDTVNGGTGNTWPAAFTSVFDSPDQHQQVYAFVLPNALAGKTKITITFGTATQLHFADVSEWMNVAASSVQDGSITMSEQLPASNQVVFGAFTPNTNNDGNGGHVVISCLTTSFVGGETTSFTPGTGATLLEADLNQGSVSLKKHATQYRLVPTFATFPISQNLNGPPTGQDRYNGIQVALKAGTTGQAPPEASYLLHVHHQCVLLTGTTWVMPFPSQGDFLILSTHHPGNINITGVTDNKGNSWAAVPNGGDTSLHAFWYTTGGPGGVGTSIVTGSDLIITAAISGTTAGGTSVLFDMIGSDWSGGTPFDGWSNTTSGTVQGNGVAVNDIPDFAPSSLGLTIVNNGVGQGPVSDFATGSPSGAFFDSIYPVGAGDLGYLDNSDAMAHFYNADLNTQTWNWLLSQPVNAATTIRGHLAHFKTLQAPPNPPIQASSHEPLASFDPDLISRAWFDAEQIESRGWFDAELLGPVIVYETKGAFDPELVPRAWFDFEQVAKQNWFDWELAIPATPSGTLFTQGVSGSMSFIGLIQNRTGKALTGTLADSGSLLKLTSTQKSGTFGSSGLLVKQTQTQKSGTLTSSATLARLPNKALGGTLTSSGSLLRLISKGLSGSLTSAGAITKQLQRALSGILGSSGSLINRTIKALSGTLTSSGALASTKVILKALSGTLTTAGSLVKQTQKILSGTLNESGSLIKQTFRSLSGTLNSSGSLINRTIKILGGTLSSSGVLSASKSFLKTLTGTLTTAGILVRVTQKNVVGTLTTSGTLIRQAQKQLSGILASSGSIIKKITRSLSGTLSAAGALTTSRIFLKALSGALTTSGALTRQVQKSLSGTLNTAGSITRRAIIKLVSGVLTPTGSVVKFTTKSAFSGVLSFLGTVFGQNVLIGLVTKLTLTGKKLGLTLLGIKSGFTLTGKQSTYVVQTMANKLIIPDLILGDDFIIALVFTNPDGSPFDLTGGSVSFALKQHAFDTTYALQKDTSGLGGVTITVPLQGKANLILAAADTVSLAPGSYDFSAKAISSGAKRNTQLFGTMIWIDTAGRSM